MEHISFSHCAIHYSALVAWLVIGTFWSVLVTSWHVLAKLLLTSSAIGPDDSQYYDFFFGIGCFVVALAVVLLDWCYDYITGVSLLDLETRRERFVWALAAALTGIIGVGLGILQATLAGALGAAVSWQALTRIIMGRDNAPSKNETDADGDPE